MLNRQKSALIALLVAGSVALLAGCQEKAPDTKAAPQAQAGGGAGSASGGTGQNGGTGQSGAGAAPDAKPPAAGGAAAGGTAPSGAAAGTGSGGAAKPESGSAGGNAKPDSGSGSAKPGTQTGKPGDGQAAAKPDDIAVMVNKTYGLPAGYKPADLVEPGIPFIFKEKSEKRLMRKEAAQALENLVAGAKKDGVQLAGVSAFRSESTQATLFSNYVKKDGEAAARKYSAEPGHSEHQTGLAIDMSGSSGKCAAEDCFAGTKEAEWLAKHAHEYGFIIRYPKGKEAVTGYQYEPWHIRYVGAAQAKDMAAKGVTLEEYAGKAVPVNK